MDTEIFKAINRERQEDGERRRLQATVDFRQAAVVASACGLRLTRYTDQHYQLGSINPRWLLDIYPGNQRLYRSKVGKQAVRAPFLALGWDDWTLIDIVCAARKHEGE